ncbi:MAG TPA: hypothetical protein VG603_15655 [Chitinophagales bacterium]|nr:hypothetical protein [Chitinophagales bacterium]
MARTKGSDELFKLIHALTVSEKGYFQKFALRHSGKGNAYLKLFNAINKQTEFEETTLKKVFKDYAVLKVYLFDMIMDSMLIYNRKSSMQNQLLTDIIRIDFLNQKGLAGKANKIAAAALQSARNHEMFWLEDFYSRVLFHTSVRGFTADERIEKNQLFFNGLGNIREKSVEADDYSRIFNDIIGYGNLKSFYNIGFPENFDKEVAEKVKSKSSTLSVTAERNRLECLAMYYYMKRSFSDSYQPAYDAYKLELKLARAKSPLTDNYKLIRAIRGLVIACLHTNRYEEVIKLADAMLKIILPDETKNIENTFFAFTYYQYAYWGSGRHKEGDKFSADKLPYKLIKTNGHAFPHLVLELYRFKMLFEFSNHNYNEVFKTMAHFQSLDLKKLAPDFYKSTEILRIMLQVELGHFDVLKSLVKNAAKHLKPYGLTPFEAEILLMLGRITAADKTAVLNKVKARVEEAKNDFRLFDTFTIGFWLATVLDNRSLGKMIAEEQARPEMM